MSASDSVCTVSIVIKALNESHNVSRAIESALAVIDEVGGGEVILADSLSTDDTVEIASRYPIKIVRLTDFNDRCCGVGAQIGYLASSGEYIYILDGDMALKLGFLSEAIKMLDAEPDLGGVGGVLQEMQLQSLEFQERSKRKKDDMRPGVVDRLDGGGLYRRSAIEQVGYLTNRNLHAYEEFELAARLHNAGWKLKRIDTVAVEHYGHTDEAFKLLLRRWKSRYMFGSGELLRFSLNQPYLGFVLVHLRQLKLYFAVIIGWILVISMVGLGFWAWAATLLLFPFIFMIMRKGSFYRGVYSVVAWNMDSMGLIAGFITARNKPHNHIAVEHVKLR